MRACLVLLFISIVPFVSPASFCDTQGEYTQVFKDDFNTLDTKSWTVTLGENSGEGREAWLTTDNVYVENSNLVLRSQRQKVNTFNYTSGGVTSQNKRFWQYGRICISAKLPGGGTTGEGQGVWPAHWMMPNDQSCWPDHGEVDIMEMINGDGEVHGTYHWNQKFPSQKCIYTGDQVGGYTKSDSTWPTEYHEYSTEWGPDYITFLFDGHPYINITEKSSNPPPQFPPSPMFMILNTAVGGPWPGPATPDTKFPTYHYIDYVSVSQKKKNVVN